MWYKVDWNKLILLLLPTFLRKPVIFGYLKVLISPVKNLDYQWSRMREENLKKLQYNSQKCYLRGALNDAFDKEDRRITITNTVNKTQDYIYTQAENRPVYLGIMWLEPAFNYSGSKVDFLVNVPQELVNTILNEIEAKIEFYVLAGKSYQIIAI